MLTYTTCFQMRITFVMLPIVSTTWPKPVLCVMPLRKRNSGTGCFLDVEMLAHNIFSRRCMASENVRLLPGLIHLRFAPGCAGLNNQSTSQTECTHRHTHTDRYTHISIHKHQLQNTHHSKAHLSKSFRFQHSCVPVLHLKG